MKKFLLGSAFTYLILYSIGSTYFIYRGVKDNVRSR